MGMGYGWRWPNTTLIPRSLPLLHSFTMKSRKQINTIKSRKQINTGTVVGDKEATDGGVGSDLFIRTVGGSGCNKLESFEVKRRGRKTWTIFIYPDEPSSDSGGDRDVANIDGDFVKYLEEQVYGSSAEAKKQKELVAKARGVPYAGSGSEIGKRKYGPKATKKKKTKEEKASGGGEEKEPCESCGGQWHRPLTIEPPCVPIPGPQWYVACECCYGDKFEEKTGDCALCGSTLKGLLQKYCHLCLGTSHFDNSDKECKYYGNERAKNFPFNNTLRRQPRSRKKLAKKQKEKELAAED